MPKPSPALPAITSMTHLSKRDECELQEISEVMRRAYPKATRDDVILAAVQATHATSFHDAVHGVHDMLVQQRVLTNAKCGKVR